MAKISTSQTILAHQESTLLSISTSGSWPPQTPLGVYMRVGFHFIPEEQKRNERENNLNKIDNDVLHSLINKWLI